MNPVANTPNPLLSQLADINGLDDIGWWPLAPGWWALLALLLCVMVAIAFVMRRRRAYRNSWMQEAMKNLAAMKKDLNEQTAKQRLAELSILLRRISVQRFSRATCAGLEGQAWVRWLEQHDPKQFRWSDYASLLTQMPYAPPGNGVTPTQVHTLIDATKEWVR